MLIPCCLFSVTGRQIYRRVVILTLARGDVELCVSFMTVTSEQAWGVGTFAVGLTWVVIRALIKVNRAISTLESSRTL